MQKYMQCTTINQPQAKATGKQSVAQALVDIELQMPEMGITTAHEIMIAASMTC